ncbi:putative ribonuclease H-like domain-containing protein, partial [Tanacetum coccineum]
KKVNEYPRKDSKSIDQEKDVNINSTNNVNAASTNEVNAVGGKTSIELPFDQTRKMSKKLEEHRIEAIRLFLAYSSFKDFVVYQMDVNSAFLYGKIEEEVYVCQPQVFEDPDFHDKVEKAL